MGDLQAPTKSRSKRRSTTGAYRYRSRLTEPVARGQKWKPPSALKHGAFSINPAIPGEDPREFEVLHATVIEEWKPSGQSEEDRVFEIADAMWRKRRSQKFTRHKVIANSSYPHHPAFDERRGLILFIESMRRHPERTFEDLADLYLRPDKINHLNQKYPRSNYQSTSEWAGAVIGELQSFLPPAAPNFDALGLGKEIVVWLEASRDVVNDHQLFISAIHASEFIEHDLNLRERLDARNCAVNQGANPNKSNEANAPPDLDRERGRPTKKNRRWEQIQRIVLQSQKKSEFIRPLLKNPQVRSRVCNP